jgi:uncharacterized damage-inducible protein DinB
MPDRKPPKVIADERTTLQTALDYCRDCVVRKVEGLSDDEARQALVPSGTSLLWLVKHLTFAERVWIFGRFRGEPDLVPANEIEPGDTVESVLDGYRSTWQAVDAVITDARLDDGCVETGGDDDVSLRWILVHLIEETARHAGHADILRELIDGQTGR